MSKNARHNIVDTMKTAITIGRIAVTKLPQQYWRVEQLKREI